MEHSAAIIEDASAALAANARRAPTSNGESSNPRKESEGDDSKTSGDHWRKRKADAPLRHGGKSGGRGGRNARNHRGGSRGGYRGRNDDKGHKKGDLGRTEYIANNPDKRQKVKDTRERNRDGEGPRYGVEFSKEEIDAEERRPKRKVAVMIGYSGTGYKGMQISDTEKTIEGDLFKAFIEAGAVSKANADDPKKAALVRCARTDKGVHAAGNVISLKLIIEDADIVQRINEHLSPQIRVWGIERTTGSFSCYQACDSRWYEYLIPSHAFLPPHPSTWLAKKLAEAAEQTGDREQYDRRQAEVEGFWERVDRELIDPIIAELDADIRSDVVKALRGEDEESAKTLEDQEDEDKLVKVEQRLPSNDAKENVDSERTEEAVIIVKPEDDAIAANVEDRVPSEMSELAMDLPQEQTEKPSNEPTAEEEAAKALEANRHLRLRAATRKLRQAYAAAKRKYRIHERRIQRIQSALDKYVGTRNYHNYTVNQTFKDPSSKRYMRSFVINPKPILIGEGPEEDKHEWLSLKVHGQSFMMHQIRKMIGMVTLLVRCGADLNTMDDSFTASRYSIPKVPGLGLLLERPVFDTYNEREANKYDREPIDFGKYEQELEEFKQREIYQRIFREEEERNEFGKFFNHVDNFKEASFLFVTSKGLEAAKVKKDS